MHQASNLIKLLSTSALIATIPASVALSQSGRGRPKVPQPPPSATPAQPIKVPEAAAVTRQEQAGTVSRFVLRNGITVIISEQHNSPIVAVVAYFKNGPREEPNATRIARVVASLTARGTALRPGGKALADLHALGAMLETSATREGIVYSLVAPSDKLNAAMAVEADMLQNAALDVEAARRETPFPAEDQAAAVTPRGIAEIGGGDVITPRTNNDSPLAYSTRRLLDITFDSATDLSVSALAAISREQVIEFYRSHYRPENLIIAVAGDVSAFNALIQVQQLYGEFLSKPAPVAAAARQPVSSADGSSAQTAAVPPQPAGSMSNNQPALRYVNERADISQSIVSLGFRAPGAGSKDWAAIEVLAAVLGQGRSSRLARSLINDQMAATLSESNYFATTDAGLLTVQVRPAAPDLIDKAEAALFKELDRLRRELPTEAEVARARTVLEERWLDETSDYAGRALALARAEAAGIELKSALDYRGRIRTVRAEDVQRAAAKYLTLVNASIHEYEPLTGGPRTFDADSFAKTIATWAPGFSQPIDNSTVRAANASSSLAPVAQGQERSPERQALIESVEPLPVKDFSTLNGSRAYVREDHSQSRVTVALLFQGGRLTEDASTSGITELMLRSILYGTPRRTFSQLNEELEGLGADVKIVVEPDFFGFVLSVLARNADRALKLLRDAIEESAFRDDDIARARLGQIAAIRDARDSDLARSRELVLQALFPGHAYSLAPHGNEEVIRSLTREKLVAWHEHGVKRQLPLAIVIGDTDGSALVSSQIAEGFKRRDLDASIQVKTPQAAASSEKIEQRRRDYTTIALGLSGPKADSGDQVSLALLEAALNGRLRGEKGQNVYSYSLGSEAMFVAGAIIASIKTATDAESRARARLLAEFEHLARGGLTAEEIEAARASAITQRDLTLQSQTEHALEYARAIFYRKQAADVDAFAEQLSKLPVEEVKRVASSYFRPSAASAGIVRGTPPVTPPPPPKQD